MDYTTSDANIVHAGTGKRMHQDTAPVTTAVTARDMNMVIWSLMRVLEAANVAPASFDPAVPASYNKLVLAIQALIAAGGSGGGGGGGGGTTGPASLAANGYITLAGGLVLQWVSKSVTVTSTVINESGELAYSYDNTVTWPVAFTTVFGALYGGTAPGMRENATTATGGTYWLTPVGNGGTYTVRAWALGI